MKKLNLIDMDAEGIVFVAFSRVTAKCSRNGIGYYRYILEKITDEQKARLIAQYNNVAFGEVAFRYAPQVKYQTLLVFDKKIK